MNFHHILVYISIHAKIYDISCFYSSFCFCFVFPLYNFNLSCSALYIQANFTFPNYFDSSFPWYSMEIFVAVQWLNCVLLFVDL